MKQLRPSTLKTCIIATGLTACLLLSACAEDPPTAAISSVHHYLKVSMASKGGARDIQISTNNCASITHGYLCPMKTMTRVPGEEIVNEEVWKVTKTRSGWVAAPLKNPTGDEVRKVVQQ